LNAPYPLVAVDIGNSRLKLGLFEAASGEPLPGPERWLDLTPGRDRLDAIADWLAPRQPRELSWLIASVNRPCTAQLTDWLGQRNQHAHVLACGDLPLEVRLPRPELVGIDRLAGAVAANRIRPAGRGAIVVDLGSAITVDLISVDGAFLGGAILPGIGMSARALHEFTDLLPHLEMTMLTEAPAALGTSTLDALRSGLFWGAVGGVRELIARFSAGQTPPQVFLTGGAAPSVAGLLSPDAVYMPHLVLSGVAVAAARV
jgi:type III pantothenate kinase